MQKLDDLDEDLEDFQGTKDMDEFLRLGFAVSCVSAVLSVLICFF